MTTLPAVRALVQRLPIWSIPLLAGLGYGLLTLLSMEPVALWPLALFAPLPIAWAARRAGLAQNMKSQTQAAQVKAASAAVLPKSARPFRSALLLAAGAVPMWGVVQWWVINVSTLGYAPFIAMLAAWAGIVYLLLRLAAAKVPSAPNVVTLPLVWTGVEYLRGDIFGGGYGWGLLAHPLIDCLPLAAPAAIGGVYFVGFLVAALGGAVMDIAENPKGVFAWPGLRRVVPLAAVVGAWVFAWVVLPPLAPAAPTAKVAVIQTNIPQSNKVDWSIEQEMVAFNRFKALTLAAVDRNGDGTPRNTPGFAQPDLVVWPETMMPGPTLEPAALRELAKHEVYFNIGSAAAGAKRLWATAFADELLDVSTLIQVPMLIGEEGADNLRPVEKEGAITLTQDARYNSVYMVDKGRIAREPNSGAPGASGEATLRYDKMLLTPFGEFMPFIAHWPWLQQRVLAIAARGMRFDLGEGKRFTVFEIDRGETQDKSAGAAAGAGTRDASIRAVTPICFEITNAAHCRAMLRGQDGERRANLIVNVTNDGWFNASLMGRLQHLQISRWRSLETLTPQARAANTGISAFIDAHGAVFAQGVNAAAAGEQVPTALWDVDGILSLETALAERKTVYFVAGDATLWGVLGVWGIMFAAAFVMGRGQRTPNQ